MMHPVQCPSCGESNPADLEFCQYCQARLQPLTGPLKGADRPITPGDTPTKKTTSELEPMLPQWLREARDTARQSGMDQPLEPAKRPASPASEPDLLAGLRSQTGDDAEDDTPDWLASITGVSPKHKKPAENEPSGVRWVELGGREEPSANQEQTPDWLSNLQSSPTPTPEKDDVADWFRQAAGGSDARPDEAPASDTDWLDQLSGSQGAFNEPTLQQGQSSSNLFEDAAPDWLQPSSATNETQSNPPAWLQTGELQDPSSKEEAPDWLKSEAAQESQPFGDAPDWLKSIGAEPAPADGEEQQQPAAPFGDTPDWLNQIGGAEETRPAFDAAPSTDDADWLKSLGAEPVQEQPQAAPFGDTPDWLNQIGGADAGAVESASGAFEAEADTPAWLGGLPSQEILQPSAEVSPAAGLGDLPDWLKSAAPQSSIFSESPAEDITAGASEWERAFSSQDPAPVESTPAFSGGVGGADLFTEMPDWLSSVKEEPALTSPEAVKDNPSIAQGELPSWVQAMRPIDTGAPTASAADQTLEQRGALAGLQGVLPAVPGYRTSSKPKAYSIRLQASEEQQSHAALLEQILAAEGEVTPVASFNPLAASRALRWVIMLVFFTVVFASAFLRTAIFSMPVGAPLEVIGAIQVAQSLPAGMPVLVAVDYEPARAGEIEAAAAPMLDQLILLKQSRFVFVSTADKGGALVERLIAGPLAFHNYQSRNQYLNLGYLPGGVIGVRAFAQNPQQTMPFDINQLRAWDAPATQGISGLSGFAALIIIADDIDSVRAWVEQMQPLRGTMPIVVITSAQAAPMVQPYYASGQVQGMVGGLYGGALFEQNNAGRPGTARAYWDAYSAGSLLAVAFLLVGGLWSFFLGLRERSMKEDGG